MNESLSFEHIRAVMFSGRKRFTRLDHGIKNMYISTSALRAVVDDMEHRCQEIAAFPDNAAPISPLEWYAMFMMLSMAGYSPGDVCPGEKITEDAA